MARTKQPFRMFGGRRPNHICGLYFNDSGHERHYLRQIKLVSHTTINAICFETRLQQTFHNSSPDEINHVRYTFPLYDGVAVNGYMIRFGDETLTGIVKQKDDAKETYHAAVAKGETAGLLEALPSGIFGVTLGNLPAKTDVVVNITYCGELKHDASIDGLRYNLPTSIAPRYGDYPDAVMDSNVVIPGGISITVDVAMGSLAIRKVQSPSHPIAVSMGALSAEGHTGDFNLGKASATLTQGSAELADDFVLQLLVDHLSKPQAILEKHPTLSSRAIMATLVPKFKLEPSHPEIVFIADQSGSMSGSKNEALIAALKVFLKSLPLGIRFNICAFGNRFNFLWPQSQVYNESNLKEAVSFVSSFTASHGGTEMHQPIQAAFERRLKDLPLEVMLLTDGEIWNEKKVFDYINEQIHDRSVPARVFALGIGSDVSHTLVEGVARAGNGFAQFVTQNEETDQKVVRMLRGALYPHTSEYSVEVSYDRKAEGDAMEEESGDSDYDIVDKVNDCLVLEEEMSKKPAEISADATAKPKSLFDEAADIESPIQDKDSKTDRYAHLPTIKAPKLLQAPNTKLSLFPFNRTTFYLLLDEETPAYKVSAVTLRAQSPQGPLELKININPEERIGTAIHQLAARKAVQDLEEGRGWLHAAKTDGDQGTHVKLKYASRFDEIVEREAVRLGEKYQVAGKWCSFVATKAEEREGELEEDAVWVPPAMSDESDSDALSAGAYPSWPSFGCAQPRSAAPPGPPVLGTMFTAALSRPAAPTFAAQAVASSGVALFGMGSQTSTDSRIGSGAAGTSFGHLRKRRMIPQDSSVHDRAAPPAARMQMASTGAINATRSSAGPPTTAFGVVSNAEREEDEEEEEEEEEDEEDADMGFALCDDGAPMQESADDVAEGKGADAGATTDSADDDDEEMDTGLTRQRFLKESAESDSESDGETVMASQLPAAASTSGPGSAPSGSVLHNLIALQTFSGAWKWDDALFRLLGCSPSFDSAFISQDVMATALAVAFLEEKIKNKKDVWDMVVGKARTWVDGQVGNETGDGLVAKAKDMLT